MLLAGEVLISLVLWGPLPVAVLWVASQLQYASDSIAVGVAGAFVLLGLGVTAGVRALRWLDTGWIAARRADGHEQEEGMVGTVAAACGAIGGGAFAVWLLLVGGTGSAIFQTQ
jgi:hypothetical protein